MRERPISVTVISWMLIVLGGTWLIRTTLNLQHDLTTKEALSQFLPMPLPFFLLVSGIGMLKAQYWARFLCVMWGIIGLVLASFYCLLSLGTIQGKIMLLLLFIFFLVIAFSLFSPKAEEYFEGTKTQGDSKTGKDSK